MENFLNMPMTESMNSLLARQAAEEARYNQMFASIQPPALPPTMRKSNAGGGSDLFIQLAKLLAAGG